MRFFQGMLVIAGLGVMAVLPVQAGRKPASVAPFKSVELEFVRGERRAEFVVTSDSTGGGILAVSSEQGLFAGEPSKRSGSVPISRKNTDYLLSRIEKLESRPVAVSACPRAWIRARVHQGDKKVREVSACLGDKSANSKSLFELANLLAVAI